LIDLFTLALTHGLIALALWRMLFRADLDLDDEEPRPTPKPWRRVSQSGADGGQGSA